MIKKKNGSTLIVAIIIFMFISTVSIAMLSMISSNYRARVSERNRVENLYSSESGLDIAYNIMVKTFDAATIYGHFEVEEIKSIYKDSKTEPNTNSPNYTNYTNYKYIQDDIVRLKDNIKKAKEQIAFLRKNDDIDKKSKIAIQNNFIQKYNELINEDNKMLEILLNEEFKRAFKYFINDPNDSENYQVSHNVLKDSMSNKTYVNKVSGINNFETVKVDIPNTTKQKDASGNEESFPKLSASAVLTQPSEPSKKALLPDHSDDVKNLEIDIQKNNKYAITLQSIFQSTKENTNTEAVGNNMRTVQATYNMFVPEYSDIFFGQGTDNINEYVALDNKALMVGKEMTVGKGMTVNNADKVLEVNGDVFVEGKLDPQEIKSIDNSNRTYEKYHSGIIINSDNGMDKVNTDKDNVIFYDNVITRGTFNLQNKMKVKINGDLYANNLYAGKISASNTDLSKGSVLNANNVVLDNDLAVKANDTHIIVNNKFYGINDKNIDYNDYNDYNRNTIGNGNSHVNDKVRTSSSIIVNSQEPTSTIEIKKEAYIMGVAHINTEHGYQTGESTAVKGNYVAYAVPIDSKEEFIYDDPLQVLKADNVFAKAEHFSKYWNKNSDGDIGKNLDKPEPRIEADNGGIMISLPDKVYSTGAIVYKDKDKVTNKDITTVRPSNYNLDLEKDIIDGKRNDYARNVYRMGADPEEYDYDLLGTNADSVEDLLDFSDYAKGKELEACDKNGQEMAIFNQDETKDIEIHDNIIKVGDTQYTFHSTIKAVIATKGKVTIKDNVHFIGSIITCDNLNIEGKNISITYDEGIINRIKLKNSELFKNVFKYIATKDIPDSSAIKEVDLEDVKSQYDISKFLENKLWKLIK